MFINHPKGNCWNRNNFQQVEWVWDSKIVIKNLENGTNHKENLPTKILFAL